MPTELTRKINNTLVSNPELVQSIFQDLFGKHMLKYYGDNAKKFKVKVSNSESSYMNFKSLEIVISMNNILDQLRLGINVYAVGYHELAHILYTSDEARDSIRVKTLTQMFDDKYQCDPYASSSERNNVIDRLEKQLHMLWNIVEDERIERELMKEHPFLVDIIDPLKTIIKDDGKIMSWRLGKYAEQKVKDPRISKLCEDYISIYNSAERVRPINANSTYSITSKSLLELSNVLYELHKLMFPQSKNQTQQQDQKQNAQDDQGDQDDQNQQSDNAKQDNNAPKEQGKNGKNNKQDDEAQDDQASKQGDKDGDKGDDKDDEQSEEVSKLRAKREDDLNKLLEDQIKKSKELIETARREASYNESVISDSRCVVLSEEPIFKNFFFVEIPLITQQRANIRGGITQAQIKSFNSNISNKVNVPRLVESLSANQEPKVFYNKGKDVSFLRKVVIFEDVSSSTCGSGHLYSPLFSMIAYSLAKSFDECDWWIYGDFLAKKHKKDYHIPSVVVGRRYNIAMGTQSNYLVNVMRKYAKEKALFVVITDGDIKALINEEELFSRYVNQTAFIGYIHKDYTKNLKYTSLISEKLRTHLDYVRRDGEYQRKLDINYDKVQRWAKANHSLPNREYIMGAYYYGMNMRDGFEVILKDTMLRQYVVDSVKTIVSVMKGAMK